MASHMIMTYGTVRETVEPHGRLVCRKHPGEPDRSADGSTLLHPAMVGRVAYVSDTRTAGPYKHWEVAFGICLICDGQAVWSRMRHLAEASGINLF